MKRIIKLLCILNMFLFISYSGAAQDNKKKFPKYEFVGSFNNGLAKVRYNKKWGYIDTTGAEVFPPKYNEVENFSDGLARVRLGQKWGLVDTTGKEVIKPTFDAIFEFINGKAQVLLDGQKYYMNKQGQRVD